MKQPKKQNKMSTKYDVAFVSYNDALLIAQAEKEVFECRFDTNYLYCTDENIAVYVNVPYTMGEIDDNQNNEMFQLEWDGTGPVFKKRKMFPR